MSEFYLKDTSVSDQYELIYFISIPLFIFNFCILTRKLINMLIYMFIYI